MVSGEVIGRAVVKVVSEVDRNSATGAGTKMGDLLTKSLKGAAIGTAGAVGGAIGATLFKGFQRLSAIEDAKAKLTGLGNSAKDVATIMENSLAAVKGTAFGLGEAATVSAQLVAAQAKPGKELEAQLKSVANLAAAAGIGLSEMGSIYAKAMTQANGVQNDVLGQLQDRGLPIYQELAELLGVTAGEVFELAKSGQISFEEFAQAAEEAGGTVADEMGKTVSGSFKNMEAALGRVGAAFLEPGFKSGPGLLSAITEELDDLVPLARTAGEYLATVATALDPPEPVGTGSVLAPNADEEDVRGKLQEALDASAEEAGKSWWEKFLLGVGRRNQSSVTDIPEIFDRIGEVWGDALDGGIVDGVNDALENAEDAVADWFDDVKENWREGWEEITSIWPDIQAAFEEDWENLKTKFGDLWDDMLTEVSGFVDDLRETGGEWKDAGVKLIGDFVSGLGSSVKGKAGDIAQKIKDAINDALPNSLTFFGGKGGIPAITIDLPQLASGARNFAGGLALVGETGPELVSLPAGADVYSNSESRGIAATGGGNTNIFNITGPTSLAELRQQADWYNTYGTRFGS